MLEFSIAVVNMILETEFDSFCSFDSIVVDTSQVVSSAGAKKFFVIKFQLNRGSLLKLMSNHVQTELEDDAKEKSG